MTDSPPAPAGAPDLAWPIVGFRQWRLIGGVLKSMFVAGDWLEAEQHARCYAARHDDADVPAKECSCGIYAYYDPVPRTASAATRELVAGVVVLWGQLELHATGMRAEHARLVALELPIGPGRKRRDLVAAAERLSVPAVPHRGLRAAASDDGFPLGFRLRPTASTDPYQRIGTLPSVPWDALAPERRQRYRRRIIPPG
jgi:hypothetical protein